MEQPPAGGPDVCAPHPSGATLDLPSGSGYIRDNRDQQACFRTSTKHHGAPRGGQHLRRTCWNPPWTYAHGVQPQGALCKGSLCL
eukprot:203543-Chlamydomonas_euryale.AAC.4